MPSGRFAPSPTGPLHLGNLRTALVAWLAARWDGSAFLVRMEDLDRVTSSRAHEADQLAELAALGLDWDPPVLRQSDRFDRYREAIDRLVAAGRTYPCWCTRREIAGAAAAPHDGDARRYPGTCRDLSDAERAERAAGGRPAALRFRSDAAAVTFDDAVVGPYRGTADDVVLRRNDGVAAYNLAVVVDDAEQGIEQVVRGDDLLAVTPSQVTLARALGIEAPSYAHVPLVLGPDGQRLAKRHGAVTLEERLAMGETAAQVVGRLAAGLGLHDGTPVTPTELLAGAGDCLARLRRGPQTLDLSSPSDPGSWR